LTKSVKLTFGIIFLISIIMTDWNDKFFATFIHNKRYYQLDES